ncbi:MAG: hypothetical protein ABSA72_08795 [Nitrososphaerales archaeon]
MARVKANTRIILVIAVVVIAAVALTSLFYVLSLSRGSASSGLPPGCTKPSDGFLIVASNLGYNDSELHFGEGSWPVLNVTQGSTVNITVCNTANYAHGFQISTYYQGSLVTISPGEVLHIPAFVADKPGNFLIYCSIPCPIHIYMQYGELSVSP